MPPSNDLEALLLTLALGSAGNYDPTVPLARVMAKDSLHTGRVYLRATLEEMVKIRNICKIRDQNHRDLLRETTAQFDELMRQKKDLESLEKRSWVSKIFKFVPANRAKRAFVADAHELWESTRTTSDMLKRDVITTSTASVVPVERQSVAQDEQIDGVVVYTNGPITQEGIAAVQEMRAFLASVNRFGNPTPSDNQDGQSSTAGLALEAEALSAARDSTSTSPSSPGSASSFNCLSLSYISNTVNNANTSIQGFAINNNGSGNSGADTIACSSVNDPPS